MDGHVHWTLLYKKPMDDFILFEELVCGGDLKLELELNGVDVNFALFLVFKCGVVD